MLQRCSCHFLNSTGNRISHPLLVCLIQHFRFYTKYKVFSGVCWHAAHLERLHEWESHLGALAISMPSLLALRLLVGLDTKTTVLIRAVLCSRFMFFVYSSTRNTQCACFKGVCTAVGYPGASPGCSAHTRQCTRVPKSVPGNIPWKIYYPAQEELIDNSSPQKPPKARLSGLIHNDFRAGWRPSEPIPLGCDDGSCGGLRIINQILVGAVIFGWDQFIRTSSRSFPQIIFLIDRRPRRH